ncbi:MAG: hypothetical protein Q4D98_13920 [Planctomycetia bacterium]|nr:hypothetical protein [Planctomycetia bacterium]
MQTIVKPSYMNVSLCMGSREWEDMRTAFCPEDFPFPMRFWQQKNPPLGNHPSIDRSNIGMKLWEGESLSVESVLTEAWERLKPHWDKIHTICEKNLFHTSTGVEVWLNDNIQQIQFGISREVLEKYPWGTCFAIFPLNWEGKSLNYGSDQKPAEYSFLAPLMRLSISNSTDEKYPEFQERTQDLDVAVVNALEFWERRSTLPSSSTPLELKIRLEPIHLYRLGFYLENATIQKLKKRQCRLDIRFTNEFMENEG